MIQAAFVMALCCQQTSAATLEAVRAQVDSLGAVRDSLQADVDLVKAQVDSLKALQKELEAAQEPEPAKVFVVSDVVGGQIDVTERERYGLFTTTAGFVSATYYQRPDRSYYVELVTRSSDGATNTIANDVVAAGISYLRSRIEQDRPTPD
jgi:hypothetical protein